MSFLSRYPARLFLWQPQTAEPGMYPIGAFSASFTRVTASETTRGIPYTPREVLPSKLASRRTDMPSVPSQRTAVIISLWPLPPSQGHTVSHGLTWMSPGMGGREEQSHQLFAAAGEWGPGGLRTQHSHTEGPTSTHGFSFGASVSSGSLRSGGALQQKTVVRPQTRPAGGCV